MTFADLAVGQVFLFGETGSRVRRGLTGSAGGPWRKRTRRSYTHTNHTTVYIVDTTALAVRTLALYVPQLPR